MKIHEINIGKLYVFSVGCFVYGCDPKNGIYPKDVFIIPANTLVVPLEIIRYENNLNSDVVYRIKILTAQGRIGYVHHEAFKVNKAY